MENIELILFGVFIGFAVYAVLLLVPIYRFLQKEEETARELTRADLERQLNRTNPSVSEKESAPDAPSSN